MRVKHLLFAFLASAAVVTAEEKKSATRELVVSVMRAAGGLKQIPFSEVVEAATGKKVTPFDTSSEADRELLAKIGKAMDEVIKHMNAPDSPGQKERRINEVSAHFENEMKQVLNEVPGFACDFPVNAQGKVQRSGYPDLRLVEKRTGRLIYLDPKLYEQGSRASTLRTFYFEPKTDTNKILDDAHHLLVGFEHDGRKSGQWKFLNWELVDLSRFQVRLKAEFQGSNKDIYRPELVVGTSRK